MSKKVKINLVSYFVVVQFSCLWTQQTIEMHTNQNVREIQETHKEIKTTEAATQRCKGNIIKDKTENDAPYENEDNPTRSSSSVHLSGVVFCSGLWDLFVLSWFCVKRRAPVADNAKSTK